MKRLGLLTWKQLGVTLILTLDSLSAFAEGNDFLRQRYRPFVRFT